MANEARFAASLRSTCPDSPCRRIPWTPVAAHSDRSVVLLNFGVVANAALVVLGLFWCREMLGRWRRDLDELRSGSDANARLAIVALWVATAVILVLLITFTAGILKSIGLLWSGS